MRRGGREESGIGAPGAGASWSGVRSRVASAPPFGYLWSLRKSKLGHIFLTSLHSEAQFVL